jgi:ribosome small subunit-dependent GTPase A
LHPATTTTAPPRRIILVGNPNVGKSVIFSLLTGQYVTVSNYPGTTVEVSRGRARGWADGTEVIDTPGMRELELCGIVPAELRHYYRDFTGPAAACEYGTCLHVDEERCGVRDAVESGDVHADRYESYLRSYEQVCESDRARREQTNGGKRAR